MGLLDTFEAAKVVGLSRATLAKLRVYGGGPPFVKVGEKVLYDAHDLASWIADRPRHLSTSAVRVPARTRQDQGSDGALITRTEGTNR